MKVELVSKTIGVGKYEDLDSEQIVSSIARHGIIKKDGGRLIKYLMKNKHFSPLDMVNFGFEIETSRAIGRQLLRHWTIKPQEHSQRYSDRVLFEDISFRLEHPTNRQSSTEEVGLVSVQPGKVVTESLKGDERLANFMEKVSILLEGTKELYEEGRELGLAKECLRMCLPECTTTTMTMNGSLRSWLTFLNLRMDHHTQKEARDIALQVGLALEQEMPRLFEVIDWRKGMFI